MIDKEIFQILCCPACKRDLKYLEEYFVCENCKLMYPIKDDIPILIVEEASRYDKR